MNIKNPAPQPLVPALMTPAGDMPGPKYLMQTLSDQFGNARLYGETLLVLGLALLLGATLAYHPSSRRKVTTRAALEQPKTLVMYALVGALVGHIVALNQLMALVVFGIGGLMRFRTDVGEAKDTGRVILAAIVGICCGMQSFLIAVLATAFGWLLVWRLERQIIGSVQVLGIETGQMQAASDAYTRLLTSSGCSVVGLTRNPKRASFELVFTARPNLDETELKAAAAQLPQETRGSAAWELS